MTPICFAERNALDRKLTDEDEDLAIPHFSPDQYSIPITYVDFESGRQSLFRRAGTSKAFPAIGQLRVGGSSAKAGHNNPAKEGVPGNTIFQSRADAPPRPATAPGDARPRKPPAGRTFFRPDRITRPEGTARRKRSRDVMRRAAFIRELNGALKFAGLCLVFAFSIGTWIFLAAVLGRGIIR